MLFRYTEMIVANKAEDRDVELVVSRWILHTFVRGENRTKVSAASYRDVASRACGMDAAVMVARGKRGLSEIGSDVGLDMFCIKQLNTILTKQFSFDTISKNL